MNEITAIAKYEAYRQNQLDWLFAIREYPLLKREREEFRERTSPDHSLEEIEEYLFDCRFKTPAVESHAQMLLRYIITEGIV